MIGRGSWRRGRSRYSLSYIAEKLEHVLKRVWVVVDWIDIAIMVRVHMAIREETVRKQGEENEFGKSQKLIA
jgi:hypothetical protein